MRISKCWYTVFLNLQNCESHCILQNHKLAGEGAEETRRTFQLFWGSGKFTRRCWFPVCLSEFWGCSGTVSPIQSMLRCSETCTVVSSTESTGMVFPKSQTCVTERERVVYHSALKLLGREGTFLVQLLLSTQRSHRIIECPGFLRYTT